VKRSINKRSMNKMKMNKRIINESARMRGALIEDPE
jgi:hypothetical protein